MSTHRTPVNFNDLEVGDIFYTIQPYRQYYVKLAPFEDENGEVCNVEELESGRAFQWSGSSDYPIYRDDGRQSWEGPSPD